MSEKCRNNNNNNSDNPLTFRPTNGGKNLAWSRFVRPAVSQKGEATESHFLKILGTEKAELDFWNI